MNSGLDSTYLKYVLSSPYGQGLIAEQAVGSTQAKLALHRIKDILIPLPPVNRQRAIAELLGALDDKIAANSKLIRTAKAYIQAEYTDLIQRPEGKTAFVEDIVKRLVTPRRFTKAEITPHGDFPIFDQSEAGFLGYLSGDGYFEASEDEPVLYFGDHTCKLGISAERFAIGPNTIPFVGRGVPALVLYFALQGVQRHERIQASLANPHEERSEATHSRSRRQFYQAIHYNPLVMRKNLISKTSC